MRRAGFVLFAAVLALAGCKSTDSKSGDKSPGNVAGRPKKDGKEKEGTPTKNPTWLDDVGRLPGAGTGIPKGGSASDPLNPNFDPKTAAQDTLGGRVLDPNGKPARNIYVRIEEVGASPEAKAPMGIYTKDDGYFLATGWKPGKAYELTAQATTADGRKLTGVVQTKVPNPVLLILLRDDLPPPPVGGVPPPKVDGGQFPPEPRPSDKVSDNTPPPKPPVPKSGDGGWSPGGPTTGVPPATIGAKPTPGTGGTPGVGVPPPDVIAPPPAAKPDKPENIADTPKDPFKPPAANIPVGPPPIPALPPLTPPGAGKSSMGTPTGGAGNKLSLLDTWERPWDLDSVKPGSLVLVEFTTSTCLPCKQVIPVMKDLQSRYGASGLQVAAVMCDNTPQSQRVATAAKYSRDHNLNYTMYVEPGTVGSVRDRYDVDGYPTAVLLDSTGRVLWKGHPGEKTKLESTIKQNLGK